jgi:hypothetical protein
MRNNIVYSLVALVILAIPFSLLAQATTGGTSAYSYNSEGILGCGQQGSYAMSVGALSAIGGVYVPVNDAAVTLNTGTLVYKECVLRTVVDKITQGVVGSLFRQEYTSVQTGNNGNPQYSVNTSKEIRSRYLDPVTLTYINNNLTNVDPSFNGDIKRALARNYVGQQRPDLTLKCNFSGSNLQSFESGQTDFDPNLFYQAMTPQCQPQEVYYLANEQLVRAQSDANSLEHEQLMWGRGMYPITDNASNPLDATILTPSSVVQTSFQNTLNQSTNMVSTANDIGQLPGALLAGLSTQILSGVGNGSLAGLAQSAGGQSSYLDQVSHETSQGVVNGAVSAALTILGAAQQTEAGYLQIMNNIAGVLTQTIGQLRSTENRCWGLIIPAVQQYASQNGMTLRIATSTQFSQQVIDSQITPIATTTINNITISQRAVQLIAQLIAGVQNTTSTDAQQLALQQLDALAAKKALHTQYDVQSAQQQQTDVQTTMSKLITDTADAWGNSTDPNVGWCNIQNPAVLQMWATRWKQ